MADLQRLREFAQIHGFDLTRPLRHEQVALFAETWRPRMKFYWDEWFFPIALDEMITMVETHFASFPPVERNEWRVTKLVRSGSWTNGVFRTFDPPVVYVSDGIVSIAPNQSGLAVRILTEGGTTPRAALAMSEVGESAVVTHGASQRCAKKFFGPLMTISGLENAEPGEPYLPRVEDPNNPQQTPRITVMSALLNLFELLKYELLVAEDGNYPPDGMRLGFNIIDSLIRPQVQEPQLLTPEMKREFLLAQIAWHESNGSTPAPSLPPGWRLDRVAWDAVTRFTFLEYYFFYAYNDFERYQTAIFDNEHEADDEGCCLVFDRNQINLAAASPDPSLLLRVVPTAIITSVHEEYMNADLIQFIPPPVQQPGQPQPPARQVFDPTVFIAGGSHATYLTPGTHDLVDFGDYWGWVNTNAPWLLIVAPVVLVIAIILSIIEHFVDTEDFTSEDGIHSGPDDIGGVLQRVIVLPMSSDNHIYNGRPENDDLLLLRSYAGKWGGHDGIVDHSPPFAPKTGRYFRKLLDGLT